MKTKTYEENFKEKYFDALDVIERLYNMHSVLDDEIQDGKKDVYKFGEEEFDADMDLACNIFLRNEISDMLKEFEKLKSEKANDEKRI